MLILLNKSERSVVCAPVLDVIEHAEETEGATEGLEDIEAALLAAPYENARHYVTLNKLAASWEADQGYDVVLEDLTRYATKKFSTPFARELFLRCVCANFSELESQLAHSWYKRNKATDTAYSFWPDPSTVRMSDRDALEVWTHFGPLQAMWALPPRCNNVIPFTLGERYPNRSHGGAFLAVMGPSGTGKSSFAPWLIKDAGILRAEVATLVYGEITRDFKGFPNVQVIDAPMIGIQDALNQGARAIIMESLSHMLYTPPPGTSLGPGGVPYGSRFDFIDLDEIASYLGVVIVGTFNPHKDNVLRAQTLLDGATFGSFTFDANYMVDYQIRRNSPDEERQITNMRFDDSMYSDAKAFIYGNDGTSKKLPRLPEFFNKASSADPSQAKTVQGSSAGPRNYAHNPLEGGKASQVKGSRVVRSVADQVRRKTLNWGIEL